MFQGNLNLISVPNLLQLLSQEKKSGAIHFSFKGKKIGTIFLSNGEIIAASVENLHAREALFKLINLKEGEFQFNSDTELPEREIYGSCEMLLLEALRQEDEAKEFRKKVLSQFKGLVSSIEKPSWEELFKIVDDISETLDFGDIEFVYIKDDNSSLIIRTKEETLKFNLIDSSIDVEDLVEGIKKFLSETRK